ncbi:molybdopterin dinucleotide binding domain-containing protein [Sulfuriferula nivalis]|uniref:molybdopterin dinucleotide binding domain-containing protein n=1 Tax=Sulfuriferula nivalis TaxID=2675298 RepID=UPI0022B7A05A|nr:molybdopterin dinucleotide binding domain-containing protein [Sulfuriferula nivalis]
MDLSESSLYEQDENIISSLLDYVRPGLSFEHLSSQGTVYASDSPRIQFPERQFATPSGKIEIDSAVFLQEGLGSIPKPTAFKHLDTDELRLLSPSHALLMNSSYGNDPRILRRLGAATILVNTTDADRLNLSSGDQVDVCHGESTLRLTVEVSEVPPVGVAVCYKSRWPGLDAGGANINLLNPALRADLGDGTAVNSLVVRLRPIHEQHSSGAPLTKPQRIWQTD